MKIKLIKNWGNYKTGHIFKDPDPVTVEALVNTHKVAEIVKGKGDESAEEKKLEEDIAAPSKDVSEKSKK